MKKTISILVILLIVVSSYAFAESDPIKVEFEGQELIFDVDPIIIQARTIVPVRVIFEALGLEVSWDDQSKMVTGKNQDTLINLQIDNENASVNGQVVKLDLPPVIINGRTMVSARFIGEAIGANVTWDEATRTVSINESGSNAQEYKETLTYSNLLDKTSQDEVRNAMVMAGIPSESIDLFFQDVNNFNSTVEGVSLVKDGFVTIDSLEPEYDLIAMLDIWDAKHPYFIGYNCRIATYNLMKDTISIGKVDTENAEWMVFDEYALENSPIEVFSQEEHQGFQTLFASAPAEPTKDVSVHLENIKDSWKSKEIEFSNEDKRTIISVFFHDFEDYLFIGHMGVLIPTEEGKLLFIEKLSFQAPYQAIKFDNRVELNDYLMNKYDISSNQPTAKPFIMENDQLLEGYRGKPNNIESDSIE